jgi:hypothetical protein
VAFGLQSACFHLITWAFPFSFTAGEAVFISQSLSLFFLDALLLSYAKVPFCISTATQAHDDHTIASSPSASSHIHVHTAKFA